MNRKEKEKAISLHLNVISRMATGRDVDVTVVDKGEGTYCDVVSGKIFIEDLSEDMEILIGLGFHEIGHAIATASIDYRKEYGVPEDDCKLLHNQMNSLEDYRIERKMAQIYPPAEYYLKKMARWWRLEGAKERQIGEMVSNPQFPLHLLLDNIDLSRFIPKEPREEIRKLRVELREMRFDEYPSTRALFPVAKMVYYRLKPFFPKGAAHDPTLQQMMVAAMPTLPCNKGLTRSKHPVMEEIGEGQPIGEKPADKEGSGIPALDFQNAIDKEADTDKEHGELKVGGKPPTVKRKEEYVRPYEPTVKRITEINGGD